MTRVARILTLTLAVLIGAATCVLAQEATPSEPPLVTSPILVISYDALYSQSEFGQRVAAEQAADEAELASEDARLEAELEAEELALTELRDTATPADFRKAADDFDTKVETTRSEQFAKQLAIARRAESEQQRFFSLLAPVQQALLAESNALLIVDSRAVFALNDLIDVTGRAVFQANRLIGDGTVAAPQ